jgi:hypothetical protein
LHRYEEKRGSRSGKLLDRWKIGRPWLLLDHVNGITSCTWCGPDAEWTSGKVETFNAHAKSQRHKASADKVAAQLKLKTGVPTEAMKMIGTLNQAVIDKLAVLFRNAHALSLAGRPFSDFTWMARLDQMKGVDTGSTYINNKRAKEFVDFIAKAELNKLKLVVESSRFMSIMSDGSTDISVKEVEMVYGRSCTAGVVKVKHYFSTYIFIQETLVNTIHTVVYSVVLHNFIVLNWQKNVPPSYIHTFLGS